MKKAVVCCLFCVMMTLCGCSASGESGELISRNWSAKLEGGGEASLRFDGEYAEFALKNGGEQDVIKGKYVADDSALVIFDGAMCQNYHFDYVPHGDMLEISYNGGTIKMFAEKKTIM